MISFLLCKLLSPTTNLGADALLIAQSSYKLGVHDMHQASRKAEPGDYKRAVNDMQE